MAMQCTPANMSSKHDTPPGKSRAVMCACMQSGMCRPMSMARAQLLGAPQVPQPLALPMKSLTGLPVGRSCLEPGGMIMLPRDRPPSPPSARTASRVVARFAAPPRMSTHAFAVGRCRSPSAPALPGIARCDMQGGLASISRTHKLALPL